MYDRWKKDQAYLDIVADLLASEQVQALKNYEHHHATTRLEHCLTVSYRSYRIAKALGWQAKAVARAGLLHDLFYHDWRVTKFEEGSHAYAHPYIAYQKALEITDLSDLEKDIIVKHMWLSTIAFPEYKESYLVSFVDKYSAVLEYFTGLKGRLKRKLKKVQTERKFK